MRWNSGYFVQSPLQPHVQPSWSLTPEMKRRRPVTKLTHQNPNTLSHRPAAWEMHCAPSR
eukprot:8081405-Pyramimonas_sp.AAC.1